MILLLIGIVSLTVCYVVYKKLNFWRDHRVPFKKPLPLVGNIWNVIAKKQSTFDFAIDLYNKFPGTRFYGHYQLMKPMLVITDLDLIKQICIRDFDHFCDHTPFGVKENDPVMFRTLMNLQGDEWRRMRSTLSPAFTSSKMKGIFEFMCECAINFTHHLQNTNGVVKEELFDLFSKAANDVISLTVFGIRQNSLENPKNEFYQCGKTFFNNQKGIYLLLSQTVPLLYKILGCTLLPKEIVKFFWNVVKNIMENRERHNIVRPDMIHLLMQLQKGQLKHDGADSTTVDTGFATVREAQLEYKDDSQSESLTHTDVVAQTLILYLAGFETTTTVLSLVFYELAFNPDCQYKLYKEVVRTRNKCGEKLVYEILLRMKYLDQVVSETLRKWPPGFQTERMCTKEYTIPSTRIDECTLTVKPGQGIIIPVAGIHRNPDYFPEPLTFDPDRFSDRNKSNIVPGSYMPFGVGPRSCIASRFALLEVKTIIFHVLEKFRIVPIQKTQVPLRFSTKTFNIRAEDGYWLGLKPRK